MKPELLHGVHSLLSGGLAGGNTRTGSSLGMCRRAEPKEAVGGRKWAILARFGNFLTKSVADEIFVALA